MRPVTVRPDIFQVLQLALSWLERTFPFKVIALISELRWYWQCSEEIKLILLIINICKRLLEMAFVIKRDRIPCVLHVRLFPIKCIICYYHSGHFSWYFLPWTTVSKLKKTCIWNEDVWFIELNMNLETLIGSLLFWSTRLRRQCSLRLNHRRRCSLCQSLKRKSNISNMLMMWATD